MTLSDSAGESSTNLKVQYKIKYKARIFQLVVYLQYVTPQVKTPLFHSLRFWAQGGYGSDEGRSAVDSESAAAWR